MRQVKRQIVIDIDAEKDGCNECEYLSEKEFGPARLFCNLFFSSCGEDDPIRLPACLEAEAKLKRLVEAARNIQGESYTTDEYDEGFGRTYYTIAAELIGALRTALEKVKP